MRIGVLGINYKSAELSLREGVARACEKLFCNAQVVVLSTCNRTEIYFCEEDLAAAHSRLLQALKREIKAPFEHALYAYFGKECFFHLSCVTAGLDSAVLAESEIQRQVKVAYTKACSAHHLPSALHFLFQKSLKIGKGVRSKGLLFQGATSLEHMILRFIPSFFSEKEPSFLFIGYSEVNRKIMHLFSRRGFKKITLATRCPHSAESFALDYGISLCDTAVLKEWEGFDMVISGTNHESYVIEKVSQKLDTRLILDLSVPRSIAPELNRHPSLTLLNIEEISRLTERVGQVQLREIGITKQRIEEEVLRYIGYYLDKQQRTEICAFA